MRDRSAVPIREVAVICDVAVIRDVVKWIAHFVEQIDHRHPSSTIVRRYQDGPMQGYVSR